MKIKYEEIVEVDADMNAIAGEEVEAEEKKESKSSSKNKAGQM